ncbi:hypothetical protein C2U68_19530 [Methylomonas koyamae]|nr:hypothetical protein C2U68_19530 [Methylomonas koyamae]
MCPLGASQGCGAFYAWAGKPLRKTPFKPFGAQETSGIRVSFLLDSLLWTSTNSSGTNLNSR